MVEIKPIIEINKQYLSLLEKYDNGSELNIEECKRLIGEVKLFWYRHKRYVNYFLNNIAEEDDVSFLAGAVRLDLDNNGHFEFIMSGRLRLINDPFLKFSVFYKVDADFIDIGYITEYLRDNLDDTIKILREFPEDFYFIPLEGIDNATIEEYHSSLIEASERMVLSLFKSEYIDKEHFYKENSTLEEIESQLLPHIRNSIVYSDEEDIRLTLREKCEKYVESMKEKAMYLTQMSEAELFFSITNQFLMQAIAIGFLVKTFHLVPFIRNSVTFQYYVMVYFSNLFREPLSNNIYAKSVIAYVIQRQYDFSDKDYNTIKSLYGNGKLVSLVIDRIPADKTLGPKVIVEAIETILKE